MFVYIYIYIYIYGYVPYAHWCNTPRCIIELVENIFHYTQGTAVWLYQLPIRFLPLNRLPTFITYTYSMGSFQTLMPNGAPVILLLTGDSWYRSCNIWWPNNLQTTFFLPFAVYIYIWYIYNCHCILFDHVKLNGGCGQSPLSTGNTIYCIHSKYRSKHTAIRQNRVRYRPDVR